MQKAGNLRTVWLGCGLAAVMWFVMFSPWTKGLVNFWTAMLCSTIVLGSLALWLGRSDRREIYAFKPVHVLIGLASVALLYGFFWAAKLAATAVLPFASGQIENVYSTKAQAPAWLIATLLLAWIGPAEEMFWRGFVQHKLMRRWGPWLGCGVSTAIYTLVHVWSGNLMLVGAAGVAGLFWGLLFMRTRNVWPGLISHAIWDALIFVIAPV